MLFSCRVNVYLASHKQGSLAHASWSSPCLGFYVCVCSRPESRGCVWEIPHVKPLKIAWVFLVQHCTMI